MTAIGRTCPLRRFLTWRNRTSASSPKADIQNIRPGADLNVCFWPKADIGQPRNTQHWQVRTITKRKRGVTLAEHRALLEEKDLYDAMLAKQKVGRVFWAQQIARG